MIKSIFLTLVFSLCTGTLALAESPQTVAQAVLDKLYRTNGNYKIKKPKLRIGKENTKVAAYYPWDNTIVIDQKAYQLCRELGRDSVAALAYIIGHELVHAFQGEIKGKRLKTNFLAYDRLYRADMRLEKTADVQGIFNAWLAGYEVIRAVPDIIERVYSAYDLKSKQLSGYPSLAERKMAGQEVTEIVGNLIHTFESCNYLLAAGETSLAITGYEYILQYYQGIEIYNNLGLASSLNAQRFWDPDTDKFVYPFEVDWYSKLSLSASTRGQETIDPVQAPLRIYFLEKAIKYFGEAIRIDPNFTPAHLNTVCALNMLNRPEAAQQYFDAHLAKTLKSKQKNAKQEAAMMEIAQAISFALWPGGVKKAQAEAIFNRINKSGLLLPAAYANLNKKAMNDEDDMDGFPLKAAALPETFRTMISHIELGRTSDLKSILIDEKSQIKLGTKESPNSKTMVFSNAQGNLFSMVRFVNKSATDASILADWENFPTAVYHNVITAKNGFYLKSERDRVILKVDERGRVLEMVKYYVH
jgi:tetratricopeptide (TPR) repeat protein